MPVTPSAFLTLLSKASRSQASLSDLALRRIARLHALVPLEHLPRRYPHVMNRIAASWHMPREMVAVFEDLMLLETEGPAVYPLEVLRELAELRDHYEARYGVTRWPGSTG